MIYLKIMSWFYLALTAAFLYALTEIIGKYVTDKKSHPLILGVVANFYALIISTVMLFFQEVKYPSSVLIFLLATIAGLMYGLGTITYYASLKIIPVPEFTLLTRGTVLFIIIGGSLIYDEHFTWKQIAGTVMIIISIIILNLKGKKITLSKGSLLAILTALFFAVGAIIDKGIINNFSVTAYQVFSYGTTTLFMVLIFLFARKQKLKFPPVKTHLLLLTTSAIFATCAFLMYTAYQRDGPVSLVNLITQVRIPIVAIYGYLVLKEKESLLNKIIALILIVFGTYLIQ